MNIIKVPVDSMTFEVIPGLDYEYVMRYGLNHWEAYVKDFLCVAVDDPQEVFKGKLEDLENLEAIYYDAIMDYLMDLDIKELI